jgi:hypothetical protein
MYPADRARFRHKFDKLSRRAAKTPLTSLLAGIKSATRLTTGAAIAQRFNASGLVEGVCGNKTIGARSKCKRGIQTGFGSAEPRRERRPILLAGLFFSSR